MQVLAGVLRLADALDRSHRQIVRALAAAGRGRLLRLQCEVSADPALELWAIPRRAGLLEETLGVTVKVEAAWDETAPPASPAPLESERPAALPAGGETPVPASGS